MPLLQKICFLFVLPPCDVSSMLGSQPLAGRRHEFLHAETTKIERGGKPWEWKSTCISLDSNLTCFEGGQAMSETLTVQKSKSISDEVARLQDRIMQRAYDVFSSNGMLFGRDFDDWLTAEREIVWKPPIELEERDNEFHLAIAAAGVDPKDFDIQVTPEDILIKADVHHDHKEKKGEIRVCEFASGNLFRHIHLPKKVDMDNVKAEFKNGMLTLSAPIAEEARSRKVAIQAA
jgi:HSP20 family protein